MQKITAAICAMILLGNMHLSNPFHKERVICILYTYSARENLKECMVPTYGNHLGKHDNNGMLSGCSYNVI